MTTFLTAQQVAERWGVHAKTVRTLCARGELRGLKVGDTWRISPEHLEAYEAAHTSAPTVATADVALRQRLSQASLRPAAELKGGYAPVFAGPQPWRPEAH